MHLFAFYSFNLLQQLPISTPITARNNILKVRISPPRLPTARTALNKQLLTLDEYAQFKVAADVTAKLADHRLPLPATEAANSQTKGVAFPGAITMPWQTPTRSNNSSFHSRPSQQPVTQRHYQNEMVIQESHRTEQQTQLLINQFQQILIKLVDSKSELSGSCVLTEYGDGVTLDCDSPELFTTLQKDQKKITGMLLALRGMGRIYSGFSVTKRNNIFGISLNFDALPGTYKKEAISFPPP
jgi:hypothetical protein